MKEEEIAISAKAIRGLLGRFLSAKFRRLPGVKPSIYEMCFENRGLQYKIYYVDSAVGFALVADLNLDLMRTPAFEIGAICRGVRATKGSGDIPILMCYTSKGLDKDDLFLVIYRRASSDGISVCPVWPKYPVRPKRTAARASRKG
jgi:hypothetical protein